MCICITESSCCAPETLLTILQLKKNVKKICLKCFSDSVYL